MQTAQIILLVIAILAAIIFNIVRETQKPIFGFFAKTAASISFLFLGIVGMMLSPAPYKIVVVMGLAMGLIGDMLLDLKRVDKPHFDVFLVSGMSSFGIGHIFYFISLAMMFKSSIWVPSLIALVIALVVSLLITRYGKLVKLNFGKFKIPVFAYSAVLIFMGLLSCFMMFKTGNFKMLKFSLGMVLFLASDLVLSLIYFGGKEKSHVFSVGNHTLYYAAQILIALSLS